MKKHKKKFFVLLMIFCMVFTTMPAMALAETEPEASDEAIQTQMENQDVIPAEEVIADDPSEDEAIKDEEKTNVDVLSDEETPDKDKTDAKQKDDEDSEIIETGERPESEYDADGGKSSEDEDLASESFQLAADNWPAIEVGTSIKYDAKEGGTSGGALGNPILFTVTKVGSTAVKATPFPNYQGVCALAGKPFKDGTDKVDVVYDRDAEPRRVAYYIYKKGWMKGKNTKLKGFNGLSRRYVAERMMQIAVQGDDKVWDALKDHMKKPTFDLIVAKEKEAFNKIQKASSRFEVYHVKTDSDYQDFVFWRFRKEDFTGHIALVKKSACEGLTGNADNMLSTYDLGGAEYTIYTDAECKNALKDADGENVTLETDSDGNAGPEEVPLGPKGANITYYVQETDPPDGFAKNPTIYPVLVTKNNTESAPAMVGVNVNGEICVQDWGLGAVNMTLKKLPEFGTVEPLRLAGAQFLMEYFDVENESEITGVPVRKWVFATSVKGEGDSAYAGIDFATDWIVEGSGSDAFFFDGFGTRVWPIGTYRITEIKAPTGFIMDDTPKYVHAYQNDDGGPVYFEGNTDFTFAMINTNPVTVRKVDASGNPVSGARLQVLDGTVVMDEWTTDGTDHEVTNTLEPGHTYTLREISAPAGCDIAPDQTFTLNEEGVTIVTMTNVPVTVGTTAVSKATSQHVGPRKTNEVITDTVHMTGLYAGRTYRLTGTLMNKRTGAAVPNVTVSPKEFTATASTMDVTMDFTFDSTQLADGDSVVVYETLHRTSKVHDEAAPVELAKHENINDGGQTVIYPGISTKAIDKESETQNILAGPNATIIDTVTYKGLQPGLVYTLEGELFDKTTNRLTGIKSTAAIPANAPANGTATMSFTFDASGMENHTLVVYETLKYGTVILTEHKDPNDKDQSMYPPKVETTLLDGKTKDHLSNAAESVTLHDTVVCSNLIVGRTYTINGKLVFKDNGNDVLDNGHTVTATPVTFKAENTTETKVLTFTFTGSALEGRTVVAFEDLYTNNKKVGTHAELTDEGQSDHIPKVRTTALDSETKDHISLGDESITIHDTVSYENLIPGKTYTLRGRLMDKTTGQEMPNVTCIPKKFTATAANGTEVMDFIFNGKTWQNHKTVAYEKLYLGDATVTVDENKLVGVHEDINDVDQTVHIPEIGTTALDTETRDHISFADKSVTIKDTVTFKKLLPGKNYVMKGALMNKDTGEPIKVNGKIVESEPVPFTPDKEDGSVVITFTFDGSALEGVTTVAFETCEYKNIPVAIHANLEDKAQTVHLPKIRTKAAIQNYNHEFKDTITYENLLEDRKYVFRGWLVDTVTGTKIPESEGKVELTANANNLNGTVEMVMKTDKYDDMYGHSMTAYEELYVIEKINGKDTEVIVGEHKDRSGDQTTNPQTIEIYHDLKVQKNVTGNLGDLTKVFEYTVEFTDLVPGMTYKVEGDDAKTFKAGTDGKAVLKLSLKDDQKALIKRLPKSSTYVITEAASDHVSEYKAFSEDYAKHGARIIRKEANNGTEAAKILATAKETVDLFDGTIVVVWQNNRDLATTTAVQSYLGIWAAAFALALGGIVTLIMRRRKYSAE